MNIQITSVREKDYQKVYSFQCEYLDHESYDEFLNRIQENPDLYIYAYDEEELVGICYGKPSVKIESAISLQGIAVSLNESKGYARKGIGSALISNFENSVLMKGFKKISVGAADDLKVENFYLKNGFNPIELVAKGPHSEEYERVKVSNYEYGKKIQMGLRRKHQPREVIFIFEKII